jgi:hypothetical protein
MKLHNGWIGMSPLLMFSPLAPRGWVYQNMATYALEQQKLSHIYDPSTKIVSPQKADDVSREIRALKSWRPYTSFASWALPNLTRAWKTLALNQSLVNEAMVACALERYHLAHGSYPETLDSLVPQYIDTLPQDIVNGLPLKYRIKTLTPSLSHPMGEGGRRPGEGQRTQEFLLYSVAWNLRDDGGSTISKDHRPTADEDDWVWQ